MKFKTLNDFNFKGKKVLLRSDLNSPIVKGKVQDNDRFVESAKTIKELKKKGANLIVILAHQSRPGRKDFRGLKEHAKILNRYVKVKFMPKVVLPNSRSRSGIDQKLVERNTLAHSRKGEAILMGNVRNLREEFKPSTNNKIVEMFRDFDIYVNDAFSVCHRNQTSIVSFPKIMESCVGRLMEKELRNLERVKMKNCLYVLGGIKMEEVVSLIDGKKRVLAGGMLGPLILYVNGQRFGASDKYLRRNKKFFRKLRNPRNVIVAIDYAIDVNGKRKELMLDEFPSKFQAVDIGSMSIEIFKKEIKKVKCIFAKGSQGRAEQKNFSKGTREILKAVANAKGFSVIGGGHTVSALSKMGINKKKFNYVSLSGGALADYISGKRLPGLEALREKR
jgi:phosphoglycerate kinase